MPVSQTTLKVLFYLCTFLFVGILILSHRSLPNARERLPAHVREVFHHNHKYYYRRKSQTDQYRSSFLSTANLFQTEPSPRIAIVLPFIGKGAESIPPYLGLFCSAAGGAASLVDFLIFHPGVLETYAEQTGRHVCPSNVKFINLQSMENLASTYLLRLMDRIPEEEWVIDNRDLMIRIITRHLMAYPYALVEYKPTFGHVFAQFLEGYSHWAYSDLDIIFGDLSRWITDEELNEFDIVTYGYGDQNRVYLRGQFTFHKNTPKINQLWRKCSYLSRLDQRFGKVLAGEQKLKFESAEGCYSAAVLDHEDIRVKYATKAFTDTQDTDTVYSHGLYISRPKYPSKNKRGIFSYHRQKQGDDDYKTRNVVIYKAQSQKDGKALIQASHNWFEEDKVYRDNSQPLQWEVGRKEIIELNGPDTKANCMYWAQKKYQSRLCVSSNVTKYDTVFWVNGRLYKQRYKNAKLDTNIVTAPFFHFQEWKRYYREGQLAAFRPDSDIATFVLTKEGAIPVYPQTEDTTGHSLALPSSSVRSPLGSSILHWKAGNAEFDRQLLPLRSYCLVSAPRKFPPVPPAPQCSQQVSWRDEERVQILSMAPAWQTDLDINLDVTLVLTLQIPIYQSSDAESLNGLLDTVIANLNRWQGQASVVIFHLAVDDEGQQEDVLALMDLRFKMKSSTSKVSTGGTGGSESADENMVIPKFGIDSCLIAAIFTDLSADEGKKKKKGNAPSSYHVSRKALLNMAIDAVPTRWFVSGLELERGMLLSVDAAFFAHRAALSHQNIPGSAFWLPQFALDVEDESDELLTLSNLVEFQEKGGIVQEPRDFEVHCDVEGQQRRVNPEQIFDDATRLWWEIAKAIVRDETPYIDNEALTEKRVKIQDELQIRLVELLTSDKHYALFAMDESPILLTDNQGPQKGMLAHEIAREVEEFGGKLCYNPMRMAQLATFGYSVNILPGAFAASTSTTRSAAYRNGLHAGGVGEEDEAILGGSRCDGCFMFDEEHESILEGIATDERQRPAKAAVLWEEVVPIGGAQV